MHRQLPEGGILVFVTGQAEVTQLVRRLRQTFTGDYTGEDQQPGEDHQPKPGRGSRKKQKEAEKKKLVDLPEVFNGLFMLPLRKYNQPIHFI